MEAHFIKLLLSHLRDRINQNRADTVEVIHPVCFWLIVSAE